MIKKRVAAASACVLLGSLFLAPAASASDGTAVPRAGAPSCSDLTTQLRSQVTDAQSGLAAAPPNPSAATNKLGAAQQTAQQMQTTDKCLPAVPPADNTPGSPCLSDVAKLLSDLYATLAALLSAPPPNLAAASAALTQVLNDLTALTKDGCLPSAPSPS
jgi:hypothetical protein